MSDDIKVKRIEPEKNRGGIWVQLGDEEYRIPPLGFLALQEIQDKVKELAVMGAFPSQDQMKIIMEIIHASFKRNYPSLKLEDLAELIDVANFQSVLEAVLKVSGFVKVSPLGEAQAAMPSP
jgi:hypothetical protein